MATKEAGKAKKGKENERKSAKREPKDDVQHAADEEKIDAVQTPSETDYVFQISQDDVLITSIGKEPSQPDICEPVYDEPALSELIIESFDGEVIRGLFEGYGSAVFTGGHSYDGEFADGLMHGRGKYVWADGVVYEGEFSRNQITGKGVYKWPDGCEYEGEVRNGKRHGVGTIRCKDNTMSYCGVWSNGKKHGKGRMDYDKDGRSYYDGDWVDNVRHGWGARQYPSGNMYMGMWFNNMRHGEGTMKWLDRDQIYTGQWENGIQHGMGQHIWLLRRKCGSQYPLRNMYDGEFVHGLRHGGGTFYYANGARYEGGWKNNTKHGKGKFTFKNGRIYEGVFENEHIVEFPNFRMDGSVTPDMSNIRTRTPLPHESSASITSNHSNNTTTPSFQLEIDHLLNVLVENDREEEASQVMFVVMRHITYLRKIYNYYSGLGYEESPDNTYIMNKLQFWRLLKDCQFHHSGITLMEMDRILGTEKSTYEVHNPYERILQRQFVNYLITLAYHIYHKQHEDSSPLLSWCLSKLMADNIIPNACSVQGHFYYETRRAVSALVHLDQAYEVYQSTCSTRKQTPKDPSLKMRQFLFMIKDYKLLNSDLTPKDLLSVLSCDDPNVADDEGCCNLELEMTFLEFFEALIGCAEIFVTESVVNDPTTPRPSTVLTQQTQQDQSVYSMIGTPSRRATSQAGGEEVGDHDTSIQQLNIGTPTRPPSSMTTAGDEAKPEVSQSLSSNRLTTTAEDSEMAVPVASDLTTDTQKSCTFLESQQNEAGEDGSPEAVQSSASLVDRVEKEGDDVQQTEAAEEDEEEDEVEEELDEETRQFNFWTHQVHIFFVRKFFPTAVKISSLKQAVEKRVKEEKQNPPAMRSDGPS